MEGLRSRYQSSNFFKENLFFFIEFFLSSYVYIKSFLPSRESSNHETTSFVYPSLKVVDSLPFYIPEADHIPLSESYDVYNQSCKPHEVNTDVTSSEHNPMSTSSQERYKPLKLPPILHEFPPKYYKYLPVFDGEVESLTAERHLHAFEHFVDLFEVEHDDVCMRAFAQSLRGDVKQWFRHLLPESISSWKELSHVFLRFWGERKSWDLFLSEFYAMRRMEDETVSSFNRRFAALYYDMPEEIKPPEGTAKLYYAKAFHSDLSLLLLERRSMSLQQMYDDAQEVEHNLLACGKLLDHPGNEELTVEEREILHDTQKIDHDINFLRACHEDVVPKNEKKFSYDLQVVVPKVHVVGFNFNDCTMNFFEFIDDEVAEDNDQLTNVGDFPEYDKYDDDYVDDFESDFLEQAVVFSKSENDCFRHSKEINKYAYDSYDNSEENQESFESGEGILPLCFASFQLLKQNVYNISNQQPSRCDIEHEENNELANENSLPLCVSSFQFLRENHEIIEEAGKFHCDTTLHEEIVISKEDLSLDFDSHEIDEVIQPVIEPIHNNDFPQGNLPLDFVFFHQLDRDVICDYLEGDSLFKYVLDHELEDPFAILLQSTGRMHFLMFMDHELFCSRYLEWPIFYLLCLLNGSGSRIPIRSQLLDWLHWHFWVI